MIEECANHQPLFARLLEHLLGYVVLQLPDCGVISDCIAGFKHHGVEDELNIVDEHFSFDVGVGLFQESAA